MVPRAFQTPRALRALNVAAVGLALAAVVGPIFGLMNMHGPGNVDGFAQWSIATALPSLFVGTLWAVALRWRRCIGRSPIRWSWLVSIPLAPLNAALACGFLFAMSESNPVDGMLFGALIGATFGILFWAPALVAVLVLFGAPIAWSQALARKGLAGEERGEVVVGLACAVLSAVGLMMTLFAKYPDPPHAGAVIREGTGRLVLAGLAVLGELTAAIAVLAAFAREARRRAFVAQAEAGEMAGYRVEPTPEGKVLVRVNTQGQSYRVADFQEPVFELDEEGRAKRSLAIERS